VGPNGENVKEAYLAWRIFARAEEQVRLAKVTAKSAAKAIYDKNKRCGHAKSIRMVSVIDLVVRIIVTSSIFWFTDE